MKLLSHWLVSQCCRSVLGFSFTHLLAVLTYIFPLCLFPLSGPTSLVSLCLLPLQTISVTISKNPTPIVIWELDLLIFSSVIFLIWLLIRSTVFLWTPSFALQYCQRPWQKPFMEHQLIRREEWGRKNVVSKTFIDPLFVLSYYHWSTFGFLTTSWRNWSYWVVTTLSKYLKCRFGLYTAIFLPFSRSLKIANYSLFLYLTHIKAVFINLHVPIFSLLHK